jgi:hypothetical protein
MTTMQQGAKSATVPATKAASSDPPRNSPSTSDRHVFGEPGEMALQLPSGDTAISEESAIDQQDWGEGNSMAHQKPPALVRGEWHSPDRERSLFSYLVE